MDDDDFGLWEGECQGCDAMTRVNDTRLCQECSAKLDRDMIRPLHPVPFFGGTLCLAAALWLFHRSHVDLGTNWSITLEVREKHRLVTNGLYRRVRHPMYLALLIYSVGQVLVLPNYVVGPSYGVAMVLLFALRVGPEERMMLEEFGQEYAAYSERTRRLVPGVW